MKFAISNAEWGGYAALMRAKAQPLAVTTPLKI